MKTKPRPDLHREFIEASSTGDDHGELLRSIWRRQGKSNDWNWLLASRVIVILNEAGAGKTTEMMDQAVRLDDKSPGFFLRIERLCTQPFHTAFESLEDHNKFENWRRSRRDATFFLDSVDEAKLPRDLDRNPLSLAIRILEHELRGQIHRVRIVISSRPSAWTPEMELAEVQRLVATFRTRGIVPADSAIPVERFVKLAPLDGHQRQVLAEWAEAPDDFLAELASAGAIDFARTPLDLLDLIKGYKEEIARGRSGSIIFQSLSEITDRAINRRISEHGAEQPRNELSSPRARSGARRMAAACVLGQEMAIALPGSIAQGIDPIGALSGVGEPWTRPEVDQLLACGLFTAAWEGSVRFHHRRTMERLAAEAFDELLGAGMPLDLVAQILTPKAFGVPVVPPAFTETIGWLASLNPAFRGHVLRAAPHLLIDMGDPGAHPANVRDEALRRHADRYAGGIWRGEWFDPVMLRRFAAPLLEPTCRELLSTAPADEPKRMVMDLAEVANFTECVPEILAIVQDSTAETDLRTRGVFATGALGDLKDLRGVRRTAIRFRPPFSDDGYAARANNHFRLACVEACLPASMSLAEALGVLLRLEVQRREYSSGSGYNTASILASSCPSGRLIWLLKWLGRMCWEPSNRNFGSYDPPRWSAIGHHLLSALNEVVIRVIKELPGQHANPLLVDQVERLFAIRIVHMNPIRLDRDAPDLLLSAVRAAPDLRRAIFFTVAALPTGKRSDEPGFVLERMSQRHAFHVGDAEASADLDWMAAEYSQTKSDGHRAALVDAIVNRLYSLASRDRAQYIKRLSDQARKRGDHAAQTAFQGARYRPLKRARWFLESKIKSVWRWVRYGRKSQRAFRRLRWRVNLLFRHSAAVSGKDFTIVWNGLFEAGIHDEPFVEAVKLHGRKVTETLAAGAKAFARAYDIPGSLQKWTAGGHLALVGWNRLAIDDPDLLERLSPQEARRALRPAIAANNFPSWAAEVAGRRPEVFCEIIRPLIATEFAWRDGSLRYASALSLLARQAPQVQRLMAEEILSKLAASHPDVGVIGPAAKVIGTDSSVVAALCRLAAIRFREHAAEGQSESAANWLAVWLTHEPELAWTALQQIDRAFRPASDPFVADILFSMGEGAPVANAPPRVLAAMARDYSRLLPLRRGDGFNEPDRINDARRLRDALPGLIAKNPSGEAREALLHLSEDVFFKQHPSWMARVLQEQAVQNATPRSWSPGSVAEFMGSFLKRPETAKDFRELVERQIRSIAEDLETSEFDRRGLFRAAAERDVRAFFGDALQRRSQGWFSVTQETVTAGENRTDLRVEGRSKAGETVIVELKLAGPSWSGDQLVDGVSSQLAEQYLISRKVRNGIYLVVDLGLQKTWSMADGTVQTIEGLIERMNGLASSLEGVSNIDKITVLLVRIVVPRSKKGKGVQDQ